MTRLRSPLSGYSQNGVATKHASEILERAIELAARSTTRFPNESAEYRAARTALLAEEIELRRHIQAVAAQRRALPQGGEAKEYRFLDADGKNVGLLDMFGRHTSLLGANARAGCKWNGRRGANRQRR